LAGSPWPGSRTPAIRKGSRVKITDIDPHADIGIDYRDDDIFVSIPLAGQVTGMWCRRYEALAQAKDVRARAWEKRGQAGIHLFVPISTEGGDVQRMLDVARALIAEASSCRGPESISGHRISVSLRTGVPAVASPGAPAGATRGDAAMWPCYDAHGLSRRVRHDGPASPPSPVFPIPIHSALFALFCVIPIIGIVSILRRYVVNVIIGCLLCSIRLGHCSFLSLSD